MLPVGSGASLGSDESATVSDGGIATARGGMPAWLVVVTLGALALFVAGLVTYLTRADAPAKPAKRRPGSGSARAASRSSIRRRMPAAWIRTTTMTLVNHPDGSPWFYVADEAPVPAAAYKKLFNNHEQVGDPNAPVVQVSYDSARSYASTLANLLRSDEWDAATTTPGVVVSDGTLRVGRVARGQAHGPAAREGAGAAGQSRRM